MIVVTSMLHLREDAGDLEGVREVGLAGGAQLAAVGDGGVDVGALDQLGVGLGVVGQDQVDDLADPEHGRSAPPLAVPGDVPGCVNCSRSRRVK